MFTAVSSGVVTLSLTAVGVGLVTCQVNVCEIIPPLPSSPVTTTLKVRLPVTPDAPGAMVPLITPVAVLMLSPVGRPAALKVSGSLSMSLKNGAMLNVIGSPS